MCSECNDSITPKFLMIQFECPLLIRCLHSFFPHLSTKENGDDCWFYHNTVSNCLLFWRAPGTTTCLWPFSEAAATAVLWCLRHRGCVAVVLA